VDTSSPAGSRPTGSAVVPIAGVPGSALHRALEATCGGCLLLALVQLPGALLDYFLRSDIGPPELLMGVVLLAAALVWLVHRIAFRQQRMRFRPAAAAAVAVMLTAAFAQLAPLAIGYAFVEVPDLGVLIPTPGRHNRDCRGEPRRCHDHVLNELGLRGPLAHRQTPDAKLVAMVGDSFVFGSGVGDDDTVPAVLARDLSDFQPPPAIVNAGIEGLNGGSFPGVIRYVRTRLRPNLLVVLFKDDDLDDTDILSRWDRFRRSLFYRALYVSNLEPIIETARQLWNHWRNPPNRPAVLVDRLNAIAAAAAGTQLLLVTDLVDDLRPSLEAWLSTHPGVGHLTSWDTPLYARAERIPRDGHWTENGCQTIAALLAPAIHAQLSP
jgi:hypothetical protein